MTTYLDTGDRVVVRDGTNDQRRHSLVIVVNENELVLPSLAVAEKVYEGLREALISNGLLER